MSEVIEIGETLRKLGYYTRIYADTDIVIPLENPEEAEEVVDVFTPEVSEIAYSLAEGISKHGYVTIEDERAWAEENEVIQTITWKWEGYAPEKVKCPWTDAETHHIENLVEKIESDAIIYNIEFFDENGNWCATYSPY